MIVAHDVFSETNPAFCAYALVGFTEAFMTVNDDGPELPVAYLSLPVALSGDLRDSFERTNKNTGLLEWLERNPQIQIGLADRVNGSMGIVTDAIRFGCFSRVLQVDDRARLRLGPRKVKRSTIKALSEGLAQPLKRAERLGYWFAGAGSTKTIFDMMGLTV
ncbi:three component ABC system middle component [Sorangium sp. So ce375]|uniref:three component ABC system middle component n=1 Tax=Sorangium sp. So ce375 TaxID=3133306 RepID=UPI003F5B5D26